ncbi:MAG: YecH family protein [Cephaloticoccus sp.]|nr:YecH family protein [Cephaloticoccus sp.]MCF7761502.1 YecH family protein [Cephaloticoccus sp.]
MTTQIHGHEVIEMMVTAQQDYTVESLKAAIITKFGPETRFHTCSAEDMDADALIGFLAQRGKFIGSPDGFRINPATVCDHG